MAFDVKKSSGSKSETSSEIDLVSDLAVSKKVKTEIKKEIGQYLVEQILTTVGGSSSPIAGEGWKKSLSPAYKKLKNKEGGTLSPNMELSGDMLDALSFQVTEDGIKLGIFGDRAWIADGHNKFSDAAPNGQAPRRRFLPGEGQEFKSGIQGEIEKIIADKVLAAEPISARDLRSLSTRSEFLTLLEAVFPDLSLGERIEAARRSTKIVQALDSLGRLSWLK